VQFVQLDQDDSQADGYQLQELKLKFPDLLQPSFTPNTLIREENGTKYQGQKFAPIRRCLVCSSLLYILILFLKLTLFRANLTPI
jgi:hypothetical protein